MQTLDVISVNLWQMVASLLNLVLLFLLIKFFLYKPVKKMLSERQKTIDDDYAAAEKAREDALKEKAQYDEKLLGAKKEADEVISSAVSIARKREDDIIKDAKVVADGIVSRAKSDAELEKRKAKEGIKTEIVEISTALAEKMLNREINRDDHKDLIDSFIEGIGEDGENN
jgi:F-type H+-transporting ATPase subunit b